MNLEAMIKILGLIEALKISRSKGLITAGLTGSETTEMDKYCDYLIKIPAKDVPHIQESHIMIVHILAMLIEDKVFKA